MCSVFVFKQKTAYEMRISDWSSDVCSSDLHGTPMGSSISHQYSVLFRSISSDSKGTSSSRLRTRAAQVLNRASSGRLGALAASQNFRNCLSLPIDRKSVV